jgi:serine/threonine protein kinase
LEPQFFPLIFILFYFIFANTQLTPLNFSQYPLAARFPASITADASVLSFLRACLNVDPAKRDTATQLLSHVFFNNFREWFDPQLQEMLVAMAALNADFGAKPSLASPSVVLASGTLPGAGPGGVNLAGSKKLATNPPVTIAAASVAGASKAKVGSSGCYYF